jgi:hypothetical protein
MTMTSTDFAPGGQRRRYLRTPVPLHFPVEEQVPESKLHRLLCNLLFEIVEQALGGSALIACDQFVYFDPSNPKRCLAPDVAIRVGTADRLLRTWKTWELGAPHVGVEVVSDTDDFEATLERYRQAGIAELVRFDADDREQPLRLWDLIEGDLVERDLTDPLAFHCDVLGLYWCVRIDESLGPTLRLSRDAEGSDLLPTRTEAALAKVRELEAELAKRR